MYGGRRPSREVPRRGDALAAEQAAGALRGDLTCDLSPRLADGLYRDDGSGVLLNCERLDRGGHKLLLDNVTLHELLSHHGLSGNERLRLVHLLRRREAERRRTCRRAARVTSERRRSADREGEHEGGENAESFEGHD